MIPRYCTICQRHLDSDEESHGHYVCNWPGIKLKNHINRLHINSLRAILADFIYEEFNADLNWKGNWSNCQAGGSEFGNSVLRALELNGCDPITELYRAIESANLRRKIDNQQSSRRRIEQIKQRSKMDLIKELFK